MATSAPAVNRWALRLDQLPPNPGAGLPPGSLPRKGGDAVKIQQGDANWHPTIVSLLVLIGLEIVAFGVLRWAFRSAHGG